MGMNNALLFHALFRLFQPVKVSLAKAQSLSMPTPFVTRFPVGWTPSVVIMEGMFLKNIAPWDAHATIGGYADFLRRQHIMPHYRNGVTEVLCMLFDDPKCYSLKHFERLKRDRGNPVPDSHFCTEFSADLQSGISKS